MTPARTASYGLGNPPPLQLWLHAVLMLFAELVSHAASTLQMVLVRRTRDWHTVAASKDLPRATSGNHASAFILRDDRRSASIPQDEAGVRFTKGDHRQKRETIQALILRDLRAAQIVSKDGGGLTSVSTRDRPRTQGPRSQLVIPEAASRLSGTHSSAVEFAKWIPARATLGRDDNRERNFSLT